MPARRDYPWLAIKKIGISPARSGSDGAGLN
jgi:hypothetical protein